MTLIKNKTILLVEDEAIIALSQIKNLEKYGYQVISADTGEEAIRLIKAESAIDLVLMDIDLGPGIDGSVAAREILNSRDLPIVFLSSHAEPEIVEKTEEITSYGYVVKSSSITVLNASIKMAFKLFDATQKVKSAEIMYRNIFLNAQVGLFRTDLKTGMVFDANECLAKFFGYKDRCALLADAFSIATRYVHPEDRIRMLSILETHGHFTNYEAQMIRNDGTYLWLRYSGRIVSDKGWIEGVSEDVTEEKRIQKALQESEDSLAITLNSIGDAVIATDIEGKITRMNPISEYLTGWKIADAKGRSIDEVFNIINAKTRMRVDTPVKKVVETGLIVGLANHTVLVCKDGAEYQIADSGAPIKNEEGKTSGVVIVFRDVTEEYKLQENLKERERDLRKSQEIAHVGTWKLDLQKNVFIVSEEGLRIFGSPQGTYPSYEDVVACMPKEDQAQAIQLINNVVDTGNPYNGEIRIIRKDSGEVRTLYLNSEIQRDANGKAIAVLGINQDITERKHAEDYLRQEEDKYRSLIDNTRDGVFVIQDSKIRFVNNAFINMTGYSENELLGMDMSALLIPEDRERIVDYYRRRQAGESVPSTYECNMLRKDQRTQVILNLNASIVSFNGRIGNMGMVQDITERKRAEEVLRESEKKFSSLAEAVPFAIMIYQNGYWVYTNPAGEYITGYSAAELYTMHFWEFVDPQDIEMVKNIGHRRERGEEAPSEYDFRIITKEGKSKFVYLIGRSIEYQGQSAALISVTDITERREAEEKIKSLLSEKELILKEVHHRIKNNMSVITSLLSLQAGNMKDSLAVDALEDAANRVQSMMILYDKLYQSSNYNEISIGTYIPVLIDEIMSNFPNTGHIAIEKDIEDFVMDVKKLQTLGIIINELLTNILKHAFTGRNDGKITITIKLKGNRVFSEVRDNGNGLPEGIDAKTSTGFGLFLIKGLTSQLHGTMRMEQKEGTINILEFER